MDSKWCAASSRRCGPDRRGARYPKLGDPRWSVIQGSVAALGRHALEVMSGRARPMPSGAHNLDTLRLALAAYDAAERGETIHMQHWPETGL